MREAPLLRFTPFGSDAFVVRADRSLLASLCAAARALPTVTEAYVAFDELAVVLADPAAARSVREALQHAVTSPAEVRLPARRHEIPVTYDGLDLAFVAEATGSSTSSVIGLHSGRDYEVRAIGFQPGFAYLGDVPAALRLPRRATPRARVPAGSVAIAAEYAAVYPHASPGGWHLLGRTDFPCFDASSAELTPFRVGDRVRFVPVGPPR